MQIQKHLKSYVFFYSKNKLLQENANGIRKVCFTEIEKTNSTRAFVFLETHLKVLKQSIKTPEQLEESGLSFQPSSKTIYENLKEELFSK